MFVLYWGQMQKFHLNCDAFYGGQGKSSQKHL